jgi:hypothetical protein
LLEISRSFDVIVVVDVVVDDGWRKESVTWWQWAEDKEVFL